MTLVAGLDCEVFRPCFLDTRGTFCSIQAVDTRPLNAVAGSMVHSISYYLHATFINVFCKERQNDWSHIVSNLPHHNAIWLYN